MIAKRSPYALVEFFATSERVVHAYRSAARRNKRLARLAAFHDLGHASIAELIGTGHGIDKVVLSHADEEPMAFREAGTFISGAFHLLFTEPATHPDQVARWMRKTGIRAEHRLHIARVQALDSPEVAELLGRVCTAFQPDNARGSIVDAYLASAMLSVRGPRQRLLHVPVASLPALRGQPLGVLQNFQIDPDGSFIHWPAIDAHLGWNQFLQAVDPMDLHKAQQRSAAFNRRYGAAIRKLREAAGIPQTKVDGLTDRHLRRIEQGECRATLSALTDLAKAHGLDVNTYIENLTKAMS